MKATELTADDIVRRFELQPHPEGGFYRETYRSADLLDQLPERFGGQRSLSMCTGIYYLLCSGDISALHRIRSDEMWHFYAGDRLVVHVLTPELDAARYRRIELGAGLAYQAVVPAGSWFGAESLGAYSFAGCTVAPGFDFMDFEMADRSDLMGRYPQHAEIIRRLTR